jgi:hypothetical protein
LPAWSTVLPRGGRTRTSRVAAMPAARAVSVRAPGRKGRQF